MTQLGPETEVYLTGGTGFVGTHLRALLAERNIPVTLLVREGTSPETHQLEQVQRGDITEVGSLNLDGFDVAIHLAAQTSIESAINNPRDTWEVNVDGTLNLLECCRKAGVGRVLYASTASIYGPPEYLPIDESHPANPVEPYGASKLGGDGLSRSYSSTYDMEIVVARLFNAFGPGQPSYNVVPTIISQALTSDQVELGNLTPSRDFIYIRDAVRGLLTILENGESGTAYNIARGESTSIGDIAQAVIDIIGKDIDLVSTADRQRSDDVEIPQHIADISRLKSLGWEPEYNVQEGLKETVDSTI